MHHGRDQRARQQIGSEHGENHRHGHRRKQIPRRSSQQQHRDKHDADRKRGNKRRNGDLRRAIEDGAHQRLSHADVPVSVLDLHRGVVHQNAHRQRQPSERHHVDGLSQQAQDAKRRENRERNRDTHDQRAAPAPQEQQDHASP